MTERAKKADPFDVWGKPPQIILDQLGRKDHDHLRRYVQRVTTKAYLIGRDCGVRAHGEEACKTEGGK